MILDILLQCSTITILSNHETILTILDHPQALQHVGTGQIHQCLFLHLEQVLGHLIVNRTEFNYFDSHFTIIF